MLNTIIDCFWRGGKFLYLYNMTRGRKQYTQKALAKKLQEFKTEYPEQSSSLFIVRAEEFLIWAKENEKVSSIWDKLFICGYSYYVKADVTICKFIYQYFYDEYGKTNFRNAIADLKNECKSEQYKDWEMCKVKLNHLEELYQWLCQNQTDRSDYR